jgi:hypothetical protein
LFKEDMEPKTPAAEIPADPSIADLRTMLAAEDAPETPASPATETVTPPGEKTAQGEPEPVAASETAVPETHEEKPGESAIDRRFSKLAKQRDDARQEAERLRRELEAARTAPPGPAIPPVLEAAKPAAAPEKPKPPDPTTWTGTWEELEAAKLEYIDKLTDWKVAERERQAQAQQQQTAAQALHATWEGRAQEFAKQHPDFVDAVESVGPLATRAGVADLFKQSTVGPAMLLELHQHPEEVQRLSKLPTQAALVYELGKLEARLSTAPPKPETQAATAKLPKPPAAVGTAGTPAGVDLEKCDFRTFKREAAKLISGAD